MTGTPPSYVAFAGAERIASGPLPEVAAASKQHIDAGGSGPVLVFDDTTGATIELDFRGTLAQLLGRLAAAPPPDTDGTGDQPSRRKPGRPRLGVVAREVTLLPRHWQWLERQPGGASVALRKLVEHARRDTDGKDATRRAQEAAYRFMSVMAGDRPGFEEAARALFAADRGRFEAQVAQWPVAIRDHASRLAFAPADDRA